MIISSMVACATTYINGMYKNRRNKQHASGATHTHKPGWRDREGESRRNAQLKVHQVIKSARALIKRIDAAPFPDSIWMIFQDHITKWHLLYAAAEKVAQKFKPLFACVCMCVRSHAFLFLCVTQFYRHNKIYSWNCARNGIQIAWY